MFRSSCKTVLLAAAAALFPSFAFACDASNESELVACINAANLAAGDTIYITAGVALTAPLPAITQNIYILNDFGGHLSSGPTVVKTGPGALILQGSVSFGAGIRVQQGALGLLTDHAGQPGIPIYLAGGTLAAMNSIAVSNPITVESNSAIAAVNTITFRRSGHLTINAPLRFGASIPGFGNLTGTVEFADTGLGPTNPGFGVSVDYGVLTQPAGGGTDLWYMTEGAPSTTVAAGTLLAYTRSGVVITNLQGAGTVTGPGGIEIREGNFGGSIVGPVSVLKSTPGLLVLGGTNSYTGATTVNQGELRVTGGVINSTVTVNNATLSGNGPIQDVVLNPGASLSPGLGGGTTDIFAVLNNLTSAAGSTINIDVNGPTPGTLLDQVRVFGTTTVAGNLSVSGPGLAPGPTYVFLTTSFAISPLFGTVTSSGPTVVVNYAGGDGNDFALSVTGPPGAPTLNTVTPAANSATLAFTAPGSDGGSPILDYTADCGGVTAVGNLPSILVTGLAGGVATSCVVRARNALGTSVNSNAIGITPLLLGVTGTPPGSGGSISAVLSGGGAGCTFVPTPAFIPLTGGQGSPPAGTAPAGIRFPFGLFDFTASGCTAASTITVTITYPSVLPPGTQYYKYGPTPGNAVPHWYVIPATFVGNTVTFSITDGGLGDDDLVANGTIVDQGGPGFVTTAGPAVPTLSEWMLALVALLMFGAAVAVQRGKRAR